MWYNNATNQDCKALQRVVRLAERISGSTLPSLQDIYLKRCKSRAAKIIKDSNHPGNHHFYLLPSGKRFRSMMAKTERLRRSFFPQAIRILKLSLITSLHPQDSIYKLYTHPLFSIIHTAAMCTYPVQPICTFSCPSVFFINIYYPQYTVLHILSRFILLFVPFFILTYIYIYIYSLVLCFIAYVITLFLFYFLFYYYYYYYYFFALSIERTCPDLHFTTDYTLYDCVCDK